MTSQTTSIYTPFADGRPVRDIVEHTPALVNETWCRNLLRHTLDSLEQQYASGAPHRSITPDTLVMLANGEALLMPSIDEASTGTPGLAGDLHDLAQVVHYAITAELPPDGPLGPRLYDNYSEQLTKGLDCCLGPNRRLRPTTVAEMRSLLGIDAGVDEVPVATVAGITPDVDLPLQDAAPAVRFVEPPSALEAEPAALADTFAPAPSPDYTPATAIPVSLREDAAAPMLRKPASQEATAHELHPAPARPVGLDDTAGPAPAAPRKPSAAPAAAAAAAPQSPIEGGAPQAWASTERNSRAQRWGMLAGAAIVVLAAGSALVSYLQQNDTRDVVPLSLPPAAAPATGLDAGETVVAPPAAETAADQPAPAAIEGTTEAPADATEEAATTAAMAPAAPAKRSEAVVNGTTYKLVIKPWGTVYVDGVDRGVSPPVKRLALGAGQHTIRIVNPNFPEHIMTVDAGQKETMIIEHDFTAKAD